MDNAEYKILIIDKYGCLIIDTVFLRKNIIKNEFKLRLAIKKKNQVYW